MRIFPAIARKIDVVFLRRELTKAPTEGSLTSDSFKSRELTLRCSLCISREMTSRSSVVYLREASVRTRICRDIRIVEYPATDLYHPGHILREIPGLSFCRACFPSRTARDRITQFLNLPVKLFDPHLASPNLSVDFLLQVVVTLHNSNPLVVWLKRDCLFTTAEKVLTSKALSAVVIFARFQGTLTTLYYTPD